jgi:hypothetical protein
MNRLLHYMQVRLPDLKCRISIIVFLNSSNNRAQNKCQASINQLLYKKEESAKIPVKQGNPKN